MIVFMSMNITKISQHINADITYIAELSGELPRGVERYPQCNDDAHLVLDFI